MGIVPIWGYQMLAAVFLAHLLKLNKALVLIASNISIPPLMPIIIYGSLLMGKYFVSTPLPLTFNQHINLSMIKTGLFQYITGSICLAFIVGSFAILMTYIFLTIRRKRIASR
jgi:uncharacterized protein (DUF2062 family)